MHVKKEPRLKAKVEERRRHENETNREMECNESLKMLKQYLKVKHIR